MLSHGFMIAQSVFSHIHYNTHLKFCRVPPVFSSRFAHKNMHLHKCLTFGVHINSGWFFLFEQSPNTTGCTQVYLLIDLLVMQLLFATHKLVFRIIQTQLITLFISFQLICYIFLYLCSILTYCIHIISLTPKFAIPVGKLHISPFLEYKQTTFPFQISHKSRNAHFGRYANQHMYMVWAYLSLYYLNTFPLT